MDIETLFLRTMAQAIDNMWMRGGPQPNDDVLIAIEPRLARLLEIDALEYVVVEGRIACMGDYGILRSLLVKLRPEWETNHDAVPDATARTDADRDRTDKAATRPGEGTGNTQ